MNLKRIALALGAILTFTTLLGLAVRPSLEARDREQWQTRRLLADSAAIVRIRAEQAEQGDTLAEAMTLLRRLVCHAEGTPILRCPQ